MIALNERYLTDAEGNRLGVVLDVATYERILELLEDLEDLQAIQEYEAGKAAGDPDTEAVPWEQAKAEMDARRAEQSG